MLLFGTGLFGRTRELPGLFYVATRFYQLYGVPLVPSKSFVIIDGSEDSHGFSGCELPVDRQSALLAWARAAAVLTAIGAAALLVATVALNQAEGYWLSAGDLGPAAALLGSLAAYGWLRRPLVVSVQEAYALAAAARIPREAVDRRLSRVVEERPVPAFGLDSTLATAG